MDELSWFVESRCIERPKIEHSSTQHMHSCSVLLEACRARNRAIKEFLERTKQGQQGILTGDAPLAVVFAGAATEAFINEFDLLAFFGPLVT
jgi:hypothetical protein